jgi:arylsulfatase
MAWTGSGQQMLGGLAANAAPMYYPKIYNIEMDPHEDLNQINYLWTIAPVLKVVMAYEESVKKYPNPPAANLTKF